MNKIATNTLAQAPSPATQVIRRQCACGNHASGGECASCATKKVQRKLSIGASNDPLELEADRVADQVLANNPVNSFSVSSGTAIRRAAQNAEAASVPESVTRVLSESGQRLATPVQNDMEARFGHDFSQVRIHTGREAEHSARAIQANAYTLGNQVVFGSGQYLPDTPSGKRLLAHELTHVVQQSGASPRKVARQQVDGQKPLAISSAPTGIYRDGLKDLGDFLKEGKKAVEEAAIAELNAIAAKPGTGAVFSKSGCPKKFCEPFANKADAKTDLLFATPLLLAGIATKVDPRVVPLWAVYLAGGTAPVNLSSLFGSDFTASPTTEKTTRFLVGELKKDVTKNHARIMGSAASINIDFTGRLGTALTAIDTQANANAMDFNVISDIAGNIAGGIGKDQTANKIGARPSPFNDSRKATVRATLDKTPTGIVVTPEIDFAIADTIDLCPGNCGAKTEQIATIPMSRFEATGLAGDVPFKIEFQAPSAPQAPFTIPIVKPAAPKGGLPKGKPKIKGKGKSPAKPKKAELMVPEPSQMAALSSSEIADDSDTFDDSEEV